MQRNNGIYTSGGAYSYLNLMVYLTEKYAGRDMAIQIAKGFAIDIERTSQSAFIIFEGQKAHNDEQIKKIQAFAESNYHERLTIEQLSKRFSLAKRSLERRFRLATNNTLLNIYKG